MNEGRQPIEPAPPRRQSDSPLLRMVRIREIQVGLALMLLTVVSFATVNECELVHYDDPVYLLENSHVFVGLNQENILWSFTTVYASNWHPLTWLSLQMEMTVTDCSSAQFHRTNLLLHVFSVLLLYGSLQKMTGSWPRSALVVALFAVHPLRVESVAWVSERKDVLSLFFGLLAVAGYVRYARRPSLGRYTLVLLPYAASLLSKQTLVTLPFLLLLLDYWPLRRLDVGQQAGGVQPRQPFAPVRLRWLLVEKVPLLALALGACAIVVYAQSKGHSVMSLQTYPLSLRLANSLDATVIYLRQTLWPVDLAVFYPFPVTGVPPLRLAVDALVLLGVTTVAVRCIRTRPYLLVGWLWYLGALLPVIGLVQVGLQSHADRYTYIPHIGLLLAIVWGLAELLPSRRRGWLLAGVAVAVLLPCAWLTHQQVGYWKTSLTLWDHTAAVTTDNWVAHLNYGNDLMVAGREDEAVQHWQEVVRIDPTNEVCLVQLGRYYEQHDQPVEALRYYRAALALRPESVAFQERVKRVDKQGAGVVPP